MNTTTWIRGPIGWGSESRTTRTGCHTVLVVVPTLTAGTRLFDLIPLLEADYRVQVVFTVPHTADAWHGVEEYVRRQEGLVIPWSQAVQHSFDLVLAASHRHLHELRGPILLLPHGAGTLMSRQYSRKAGAATLPSTGLDRELLTYRGRVLPAATVLTHDAELEALATLCPEAVPTAIVAGDLCWDRMVASMPLRSRYRHALGVAEGQQLITVSSTWSAQSAFGRLPGLCRRVLGEPSMSGVKVAAVLHPNIWTVHGRRQVVAWLSDCLSRGLLLMPPEEGWRATMIASDWVLGDHGSTTAYAAGIGCPVTLAAYPDDNIRAASLADTVRSFAPSLRRDLPLPEQARDALKFRNSLRGAVSAAISSRQGSAAAILRTAMYRLLNIPEPVCGVVAAPVPAPIPIEA
jgi:hypothetical protein